jgi:integrase
MTREEADRPLAAAGAPHIRLYVALGRHTAARKSALLEMRWDAVDLGRGRISLGLGTGNKRRAVLPIVPPLMDELRCGVELRTSPFVVEHAGGPVKDIKTDFHAACRRAGLAGVTPHTLRSQRQAGWLRAERAWT